MPIIGLTNTQQTSGHGLPQIAKLYKGDAKREMTKNGRTYEVVGKDLDYFRVEFEPQFEHLRDLFTELYGDKPTEFEPVFFAGATVDEVFGTWKEEWSATGLLHRCDGAYQVNHYNPQTGYYSTAKIECATVSGQGCACKQTGRLNLLLPQFIEVAGILGTVSVSTHSLHDILTVHRYLASIERMYGTLAGVPFRFGRSPRELSAPKTTKQGERTGERMKITKSLFYIHVTSDFTQERLLPALSGVFAQQTMLPAPEPELDIERLRNRLGNSDGRRRLGGGYVERESEKPPEGSVADWWQGFVDFAQMRFGFDEVTALDALAEAAEYSLVKPADWRGTKEQAIAACVAAFCEYDAAEIERYTSTKFNDPDVGLEIYQLATALLPQGGEVVEPGA